MHIQHPSRTGKGSPAPRELPLREDLFDLLAQAIDPEAFSARVEAMFKNASERGEPSSETLNWIPRRVLAREAASRVFDALKPTAYMKLAADTLSATHPSATGEDYFNMMIYAERDLAHRRELPGIVLDEIAPEEYLAPVF